MKKILLPLLILFIGVTTCNAQLTSGDLAFVGMDTDAPDGFTFITLVNLPANEVIHFTDKGWDADLMTWSTSNETDLTWTVPIGGLSCGTIVEVKETSTNTFSVTSGVISMAFVGNGWSLSSGDQVIAYQGGSSFPTNPTFLTAINGDYNASNYNTNTWNQNTTFSSNYQSSSLPIGLTNLVNCVSLYPSPGPELDNAHYNGTLTGTKTTLLALINNPVNWVGNNSFIDNSPSTYPSPNVSCLGACTDPTIPIVTYAPSAVCTDSNTTLNIAGTLNDATEWNIYTGSCGGTLAGATIGTTFEVSPTVTTTYYIRGEGGCVTPGSCATVTVVVTPSDNASFSYNNTSYCKNGTNPLPSITGLAGGVFSVSPSGLSINATTGEINLSASSPNIYGISYTTSGPCTNTSIEYVTINGPTVGYDVIAVCSSYTWIDGITYTESNFIATQLLTNSLGCDSIATLNLTINKSNITDNHIACGSYTWTDGITYTASNSTAIQTLTNQFGCDSIVTLNLTITQPNTGIDNQVACDSYTWIDGITYIASNNTATHTLTNVLGCDSVVTLNLTINNSTTATDTQVACNSYTWIDGNIYNFSNTIATYTLTNVAGCDSVVTLNLTINHSNTGIDTQVACDSYTWIDGVTYTSNNNNAIHTLTNVAGCDSVVTLHLTINNSSTTTDTQIACNSYTWIDGVTYTSSNNSAIYTLSTIKGCDSVIMLDLTIKNSSTATDTQFACDSYTWIDGVTYTSSNSSALYTLPNSAGCDSVVTLNLTINTSNFYSINTTLCYGGKLVVGNSTYNQTGVYVDTLYSQSGCDSIIETVLIVEAQIDTYVEQLNNVFTASQTNASYQWIDCGNGGSSIAGETSQIFTTDSIGNYAVIITLNNCSETSVCIDLPYISNINKKEAVKTRVYPNPTKSFVTIELSEPFNSGYLIIIDLTGKVVYSQSIQNENKLNVFTDKFEKGIYFIKVQAQNQSETIRLIKQ